MSQDLRRSASRTARKFLGRGAERLASSPRLTTLLYDLMNETNFSGLSEHEEMLSDGVRVEAYHRAIHAQVGPGDVVVDLGTGTGLLACIASRAGAAKVYAVEHGEIIDLAREIAAHNGCDNIEFVRANSRDFEPPEPIDVIVHEQMGDELFNENMVANVLDLRDRCLREGGRVLPGRFRLFVEPVRFAESHRVRRFWNIELPDGLDLSPTRESVTAARFDSDRMDQIWARPGAVAGFAGTPAPLLEFDLHHLRSIDDLRVDHVVDRTMLESGIVDGLCVWFEATFPDETLLTTSPLAPPTSWGNRVVRVDRDVVAGERLRWHVHLGSLVDPATWLVDAL